MKKRALFATVVLGLAMVVLVLVRTTQPKASLAALDAQYAQLKKLPAVLHDFTTPEGAIVCLEDAYRKHDLEAAVAAKDFRAEATLMLQKLDSGLAVDETIVNETASVLELSFRKETTANWPDFDGLESFFPAREPHADKVVAVTEVIRWPDHGFSRQRLLVTQTANGWRVLNPVDG